MWTISPNILPYHDRSSSKSMTKQDEALRSALFMNSTYLIQTALANKADPNFCGIGSFGFTPLKTAIERNNFMAVVDLVKHGVCSLFLNMDLYMDGYMSYLTFPPSNVFY